MRVRRLRVRLIVFMVVLVAAYMLFFSQNFAVAENDEQEQIEQSIEDAADELLGGIDLSALEEEFGDFSFFSGKGGARERIGELICGDFQLDETKLMGFVVDDFLGGFSEMLPELSIMLAIAVFVALAEAFKPAAFDKSIHELIFYVALALIVGMVAARFAIVYGECVKTIEKMKQQSEAVFPILLTLMTASGGSVSATVFRPQAAFLVGVMTAIVKNFLLPIILLVFVLNVSGNISERFKLEKAGAFLKSLFKWVCGISVLLFNFFVTAQGLTTSAYDSVAIKALKYALGSSMPLVSGLAGGGFDVVFASCLLIKNAVGSFALIAIIVSLLSPIIKIAVFSLFMRLVAACIEPICDKRIGNVLSGVSGLSGYLVAAVSVSSSCYLVTVLLMICSLGGAI